MPNFEKEFEFDINNAIEYYKGMEDNFERSSQIYKTDKEFVSAIVFPELVRYSIYKDFFETKVLEFYYVRDGVEAANFSIGIFQMKPSFIEQLEAEVFRQKELKNKYQALLQYESGQLQEVRKERLSRLQDEKWQIVYANCFFSLMELKFKDIEFKSNKNKLQFYASAYNHGFNCSEEEIRKWISIKSFPNGYGHEKSQYCYTEVAAYFYEKLRNTEL